MLLIIWLGLTALAGVATYLWAFRAGERVALSTIVASAGWSLAALEGGSVEKVSRCCETAVTVPLSVRYILAGLAILSLIALLLWAIGSYPPEQTEIPDAQGGTP